MPAFGRAIVALRRDLHGPIAAPRVASFDGPDDHLRVAGWIDRLLDSG